MNRASNKTNARFGSSLDIADNTDDVNSDSSMGWLDDEVEDDEQIGRVIDNRYKLMALIGRGGMGSVYKAEHLGIRRFVALKLLHPSLASVPEISRRFEREAFAIGRIGHPNCVDVTDFGQLDDGSLFLVMEYLKGHSLGDELADRERIEPGRALHILRHILLGLGHAHENDIVHRDIKPENVVLVEQDGDPDFAKILDFGIAKLMGNAAADNGGVKLTQAGMAFGTPIYMSPEQAVGNPVDGRADLYAASVMAYEMITGRPPFHSDDKIEIMSMHTTRPVPPMSELAPDLPIPPDVENVILRGLAKRPAERYATAAEYVEAVEIVLAGGNVKAPVDFMAISGNYSRPGTVQPMSAAQMTHELALLQQAEQKRKNRSRSLLRAGLMIAAIAGIAIAIAASMKTTSSSDSSDDPVAQAENHVTAGRPQAAIDLLEKLGEEAQADPKALLWLGHAYERNREERKALKAYDKALELDRSLTADDKLRGNLVFLRDADTGFTSIEAADILASRFDDQPARDKLVQAATSNKSEKVRRRAVALVAAHGLSDKVDWVESYMLDLRQFDRCKQRKEVVSKLRAAGDKRAIPALKKAIRRKGKKGKWKGRSVNRCLKQDALDAITHIKALQEATPDATPDAVPSPSSDTAATP